MGALYAQFHCDLFGYSDIKQYCETMTRLSREMPEDVRLYCSHEEFIAPASKLGEAAELLGEIMKAGTDESEIIAGRGASVSGWRKHSLREGRRRILRGVCR